MSLVKPANYYPSVLFSSIRSKIRILTDFLWQEISKFPVFWFVSTLEYIRHDKAMGNRLRLQDYVESIGLEACSGIYLTNLICKKQELYKASRVCACLCVKDMCGLFRKHNI